MSYRARQRSENKRAGGLKGRDRGWLPGSSQSNSIGIPHNLVHKTRERTTTLVTREAAANIAGGQLTEPLPADFGDGNILIDTRSLVVNTNQLGGIGRFRSQFNVDADGIKHARYYLPIYPKDYFKKSIGDCNTICEKARPDSVIPISYNRLPTSPLNTTAPLNFYGQFTLTNSGGSGESVYLYSIGVNQWLSQRNLNRWVAVQYTQDYPNSLNEFLFSAYWNTFSWPNFNFGMWADGGSGMFGALPKDTDEQLAYFNVFGAVGSTSLATWQGYLTGISNPITELWIIANAADPPITSVIIFTKLTNNPLTDYSAIPQSITGGVSLT